MLYVVRLWLPDRPGALGAVASRIGAVRGDVVGIDILETGCGQAVDELVVRLPRGQLVDLLVREVEQVDGCHVELVRPVTDAVHDPRLDALETAAVLAGATSTDELIDALCGHGRRTLGAEWMAVVDVGDAALRRAAGSAPSGAWLAAFVEGSSAGGDQGRRVGSVDVAGPDDVAWAPLPAAGLAVVVGRSGTPFRARERRQVCALAGIVDTRARELGALRSRTVHPSASPSS